MTPFKHTYRAIIAHPVSKSILLAPDGSLPTIYSPNFIDWNIRDLNAELLDQFGVSVVALRRVWVDYNRETNIEQAIHLCEPLSVDETGSLRWSSAQELDDLASSEPVVADWLEECLSGAAPQSRAPWALPGWYKTTSGWLHTNLAEQGITPNGLPMQHRNWSLTSMLIQKSSIGDLYVKATNSMFGPEPQITAQLHEWFPKHIPSVLVAGSHVMVTSDFKAARLSDLRESYVAWADALKVYVGFQRSTLTRVDSLLKLGCWDRRFPVLRRELDLLLADTEPMLLDHPRGFGEANLNTLQSLVPRLLDAIDQLEAIGLPYTLVHGDFHANNVALKEDDTPIFFDWSDAQVGLPLVDLVCFVEEGGGDLLPNDPTLHKQMKEAYLSAWSDQFTMVDWERAYRLARPVAALSMAISYRHIYHHTEPAARRELLGGEVYWLNKLLVALQEL